MIQEMSDSQLLEELERLRARRSALHAKRMRLNNRVQSGLGPGPLLAKLEKRLDQVNKLMTKIDEATDKVERLINETVALRVQYDDLKLEDVASA